jgi:hypothetical protein
MERLLQPFAIDPVPDSKCQVTDDPGIVHVADGGMIQPAQRFRLSEKPGPDGGIGVEIHPQADPAFQNLVVRFE